MTFSQVAQAANTTIKIIRDLNPAFPGGVIPSSEKGYYLTIPAPSAGAFREWLSSQTAYNHTVFANKEAYHTTYLTAPGDGIEAVARQFQCSVEDIMRWNNLKVREIVVNQELNIYLTKDFLLRRV